MQECFCACMSLYMQCMHVCVCTCMCVYKHVCICMYVCLYVHVYVCMYVYMCLCLCACMHAWLCAWMNVRHTCTRPFDDVFIQALATRFTLDSWELTTIPKDGTTVWAVGETNLPSWQPPSSPQNASHQGQPSYRAWCPENRPQTQHQLQHLPHVKERNM